MTSDQASSEFRFDSVAVGDSIPPVEIDCSYSRIVATAIASRDYQNVHHNRDEAQALGSKDIFMNILTTNGLVGRAVTDWAGPIGTLKKVDIRLGVPNYAGDKMIISGEVVAKETKEDENLVTVAVRGVNSIGDHVTGQVIVRIEDEV